MEKQQEDSVLVEEEATRRKSMAETKFKSSNLKSALKHIKKAHRLNPTLNGLSSMLVAFKILRAAAKSPGNPNWYKILQVEPFSHINAVKKQYKKLALVLHPDRNPHLGCEEAFKLVGEGFRVLSDGVRRREYDVKLRVRIQDERIGELDGEVETFWTACSKCELMHQFERKYLGHNLVCPNCKKSFVAVELEDIGGDDDDDDFKDSSLREFMGKMGLNRKVNTRGVEVEGSEHNELKKKVDGNVDLGNEVGGSEWGGGRLRSRGLSQRLSEAGEVSARSKENGSVNGHVNKEPKPKRAKLEETTTLAEMQLKIRQQKEKSKDKEKSVGVERKETDTKKVKHGTLKGVEQQKTSNNSRELETEKSRVSKTDVNKRIDNGGTAKHALLKKRTDSRKKHWDSESDELESLDMEDSDFYEFSNDRAEKSFKQGQVWAIFDDDDRMPRQYALVDEVSVNPFRLKLSSLDLMNNGDRDLIRWEKMGFHVSCGRFKINKQASINSVDIFSHTVDCERAAREIYRIYPKKGSVWALYNEAALGVEGRNLSSKDRRCYDIVVFLTTYSETYGLSMTYLEKVDGYKAIFKRRDIGCHAIRWLEKNDVRLFSHQIPARKLSGDENEIPDDMKDCWELDSASLPSDLLSVGWGR